MGFNSAFKGLNKQQIFGICSAEAKTCDAMKYKTCLVLCHSLCRVYSKNETIFCLGLVPMK